MWDMSDSTMPRVYTFNEKSANLRQKFRDNMIGGLTSVFHRHLDLSGDQKSPLQARVVPNGDPLTHAIFLDFSRWV